MFAKLLSGIDFISAVIGRLALIGLAVVALVFTAGKTHDYFASPSQRTTSILVERSNQIGQSSSLQDNFGYDTGATDSFAPAVLRRETLEANPCGFVAVLARQPVNFHGIAYPDGVSRTFTCGTPPQKKVVSHKTKKKVAKRKHRHHRVARVEPKPAYPNF